MPRGKRSAGQTQISISINKELLADVDTCADADDRPRSNWIVKVLREKVEAIKAQKTLEKEGKAAPRISSFPSTAAAPTPRHGHTLNEDEPPARPAAVPDPSHPEKKPITRTRRVLREIAKKHKKPS